MKSKRRTFWWLLAGPVVVLMAILIEAYPFLAITAPSGGKVLVVEGWMEMEPTALDQAARLAIDSGYQRIYTTGTIRPFAYYLRSGEAVESLLQEPAKGEISINVAGDAGAGFLVIADGDTLLDRAVGPDPRTFHARLKGAVQRVQVASANTRVGTPEIFIRSFLIGGTNVHRSQRETRFLGQNGGISPAWPTYAGSARNKLIERGVPADRIIAVPALGSPRSRSWGNAHAFAIQAREDHLAAFDIATLGVHARRSRDLFQTACGPDIHVGVIALSDPHCTRGNWWKSLRGWATMVKEVVGAPEAEAVEITR